MKTQIIFSLPPGPLRLGLIEARETKIKPSSQNYVGLIEKEIKEMVSNDFVYPDNIQKGIRSLLKAYGFHASGRNRPASEFLVKDLQTRGSFNSINNAVDINNHISLLTHLPISILDHEKTGDHLWIRVGMEEENYVFNREGQVLSLKNLILIAGGDEGKNPFGSPVKDSQLTKIFESTTSIIGFIYSSKTITSKEELEKILERFAGFLKSETQASEIFWDIIDSPS